MPFENVLGEEGKGVRVLMCGLDYERVVLSGIGIGLMHACLDHLMPYMHERRQFGEKIGNFQLMQGKIADLYTAMNTARAYCYAVAAACDRGAVTRAGCGGLRALFQREGDGAGGAGGAGDGGRGVFERLPVSRIMRDAKLMEIGAGTSEIRRMLIGRELMRATE